MDIPIQRISRFNSIFRLDIDFVIKLKFSMQCNPNAIQSADRFHVITGGSQTLSQTLIDIAALIQYNRKCDKYYVCDELEVRTHIKVFFVATFLRLNLTD